MIAAQAAFAEAVLDPGRPVPAAVAAVGGAAAAKRFAVYRNNVVVGLIGALEAGFPVVRRIVGDEFFAGLARVFVAAHPPRSAVMTTYGDGFADFIAAEPALDELPYLADVARLEAARTRAYHAADAHSLGPQAFAAIAADELDGVTVALHPSLEIVRSRYPIVTIWAMNAGEAALGPVDDWTDEDALVVRPEFDVLVSALPPGGSVFLHALASGAPLGAAAADAARAAATFDLTTNLIGLIRSGLAIGVGRTPPMGAPA
jgi:hypothetical protein